MKKFLVVGLVLATVFALSPTVASSETYFYFTLTGINNSNPSGTDGTGATGIGTQATGITASGVLGATLVSGTTYLVNSGSYDITLNGVAAAIIPYANGGVSPDAGSGGFNYDDLINISQTSHYVDTLGGLLLRSRTQPISICSGLLRQATFWMDITLPLHSTIRTRVPMATT